MRRATTLILFFLMALEVDAQLDSLHKELLLANDSVKSEALLAISSNYNGKNTDSVFFYASEAMKYAVRYNNEKMIGRSFTNLGTAMLYYRKYDSALYYYNKGVGISTRINDKYGLTRNLTNLGIVYYYKGEFKKALQHYIAAATIGEEINATKILASIYDNMAIIYQRIDDLDKAKKTYQKAYKMADKANVVNSSLTNLSTLYIKLGIYDSALISINLAYKLYKKHDLKIKEANALGIKGYILMKSKQYNQSLLFFDSARLLFMQLKAPELVAEQYIYTALALEKLNYNNKALASLTEALNQSSSPLIVKDVESNRAIIYEKLGQTNKAMMSYKKFIAVRDSLDNLEKYKQITELETKYETEKKSREIEHLNNQAKIQQLKIAQQSWMIAGSILFFSVLVLVLMLFYRQRSLKRKNEMLTTQQKLFRSQMSPHFIFNALTSIQKFVIKNDQLTGSGYIAKFAQLMRQVLEHSRVEFISLEEEINTLKNYLDLQQLRFDNKFSYTISIDEVEDNSILLIPPMIAQPFIENALEHGISQVKEGKIDISFYKKNNEITLRITDNGLGLINDEKEGHKSRATEITEERLLLFRKKFRKEFLMKVESGTKENQGVEVIITLPFKIEPVI